MIKTPSPQYRLELFFKNAQDLKLQAPFLRSHAQRIQGVNITNKDKSDPLLEYVSILQQEIPSGIDICVHYSLKFRSVARVPHETLQHFVQFLQKLETSTTLQGTKTNHTCSVLLVTGSGKRKFDSLALLQALAASSRRPPRPISTPIFVAFNPYLPTSDGQRKQEYERLQAKLETGMVSGIYLQMGTDTDALEQGLAYCHEVLNTSTIEIKIYGSVFIPNASFLARWKFRPWAGVFLSTDYTQDGAQGAEEFNKSKLLPMYHANNVIPLIESSVRREEELTKAVEGLLVSASAVASVRDHKLKTGSLLL